MRTFDELKALIDSRGVHSVFGTAGDGWGIEQNADELAQFLVEMQSLGIQSILEIGTGWKAGLARFLHDEMAWQVTTVDVKDYGHRYAGITFVSDLWANVEYPVFDGQFDLLIIDADHSYAGVEGDRAAYARYASKVIAFHDIAGLRDCRGVQKYWEEIAYFPRAGLNDASALRPGFHEIIASGDQRSGIGYVVLAETKQAPSVHFELGLMDGKIHEISLVPDRTPIKSAKKAPVKRTRKVKA